MRPPQEEALEPLGLRKAGRGPLCAGQGYGLQCGGTAGARLGEGSGRRHHDPCMAFLSPGQGGTNYGKSQRRGGHQNNYKPY